METKLLPVLDGKYRLVRKIGMGSMGIVYLAENTAIGRLVAVKVMHQNYADEPELRERFEHEAQAAARIRSRHVVEVLDLTECAGLRCIIMEYLEGESLAERLRHTGPMPLRDVSRLGLQLLEGVHAAHEAGVVHRDLKPENLILTRERESEIVKILDFGISKACIHREPAMPADTVEGTPDYMSPEQARGLTIDARTDLYSVAVILYECASGAVPFKGASIEDLLQRVALGAPTPLETRLPGVDPEFAAIVRRGMARDPDVRFPTALDFRNALAAWRERVFPADATGERDTRPSLTATAVQSFEPSRRAPRRARRAWSLAPIGVAIACVFVGASFATSDSAREPGVSIDRVPSAKVAVTSGQDVLRPAPPEPIAAAAPVVRHRAAPAPAPRKAEAQNALPLPDGYRASPYDALPY